MLRIVTFVGWLKKKIQAFIAKRNIKKVAAMDLEKLIEECPNQISLEQLMNDGYTDVIAGVDENGKVQDVEIVKDYSNDPEVDKTYGSERMVVVNN